MPPLPFAGPWLRAPHVHGADGLGNLDRFVEADGRRRYPGLSRGLEMLDGADLILRDGRQTSPTSSWWSPWGR